MKITKLIEKAYQVKLSDEQKSLIKAKVISKKTKKYLKKICNNMPCGIIMDDLEVISNILY